MQAIKFHHKSFNPIFRPTKCLEALKKVPAVLSPFWSRNTQLRRWIFQVKGVIVGGLLPLILFWKWKIAISSWGTNVSLWVTKRPCVNTRLRNYQQWLSRTLITYVTVFWKCAALAVWALHKFQFHAFYFASEFKFTGYHKLFNLVIEFVELYWSFCWLIYTVEE